MNLLARREQSFKELQQKLSQRFPAEQVIAQLEILRDEGLQSDERFAESYSRFRQNKGYGPQRIRADLFAKGIAQEWVSQFVINDDDFWIEVAIEQRIRKFGEHLPANPKEKNRQLRFLLQRGFQTSHIYKALNSSAG